MSKTETDWSKPQEIDDVTAAFPAHVCGTLLPPSDEIPKEFESWNHPCSRAVSSLFFKGGQLPKTKDGIDALTAHRHLKAVLGSFEPKHEHKIAGAAWLYSMWYETDNAA